MNAFTIHLYPFTFIHEAAINGKRIKEKATKMVKGKWLNEVTGGNV